ncbi:MAG: hypothetical protein Q7V57_18560 [Actinomycetota bacterium]|nr:hypothetical protein [Actinomycetota bacterium]
MDYNPFTAKLRVAEDEIEDLQGRRADLLEQVSWATHFDLEGELAEITRVRSDLEVRAAEVAQREERILELDKKRRQLASETSGLESKARIGLNVLRWFTTEHDIAKAQLAAHRREIDRLRKLAQAAGSEREQLASEVTQLTGRVTGLERALERFREFRSVDADVAIASIDTELPRFQARRDHLKARAADVDRAVEGPLAELAKYESEIRDHESTIAKLRSELSRLEGQIAEADSIDKKLTNAANSYEKALLHQECDRRFGDSSPRAAVRLLRSQMRLLPSGIRDREQQIDRIRRNMGKTEQRIARLAEVAAREIDALIIDGNNCCYQDSDFIGLAALIAMTQKLAERYVVTVVFDADIRGLLGVSGDDLRAALPTAVVHVVATHVKADETILDAAHESTAWVVSNDRFGDYREKAAVKEGRVIRHEIVRGRVLVHDLGVNEPNAEPSGP